MSKTKTLYSSDIVKKVVKSMVRDKEIKKFNKGSMRFIILNQFKAHVKIMPALLLFMRRRIIRMVVRL